MNHAPTKQHNYVQKIQKMYDRLGAERGRLTIVEVKHDDWCDMLAHKGCCNCDPEIDSKVEPRPSRPTPAGDAT